MTSFGEQAEAQQLLRQKTSDSAALIFASQGSAGRNPTQLARICATLDFVIKLLGWEKKPLANFTNELTQYQASIDAKYHNDFKDIRIAEEIERKRSERKGLSIISQ